MCGHLIISPNTLIAPSEEPWPL